MKKTCLLLAAFCGSILMTTSAHAQNAPQYVLDKTIAIGGTGGYDYLFIDQPNNMLYVSHATSVSVIDLNTEAVVGKVDSMQKVHGIAVANNVGRGFISDGNANAVLVFDIHTFKKIATIQLSGKKPDAIIYDPASNQVFAFNGGTSNVSVIDVNTLKEVSTIALGGGPEFAVADGKGKVYNNLEDKNCIKVIDSKNLAGINTYPLSPCEAPTGLAMDAENKRLFSTCNDSKQMNVVDIPTGRIVATLPIGAGVDAAVYDAATKLIFCSCGDGTTTIIKQESADKYSVVQTLATPIKAKTLALNPKTHKIYLSVADFVPNTKTTVSGSFRVMVYKMK